MQKLNFTLKCVLTNLLIIVCFTLNLAFGQQQESIQDKDQTKEVTINGVALTYIEQGEGEPVVFVHGTLGDYRT